MGISADAWLVFCFKEGCVPIPLLSAVRCWLLPGQFKLYYLLSLAHRRLRIWKAVTKFIWDEWEQIAWSRCYKGDKTKAAPLRSSMCARLCVCVFFVRVCAHASFSLVFTFCSFPCYGKWVMTQKCFWKKKERERKNRDQRGIGPAFTKLWWNLNIVPSVTKQANTFSEQRMCDSWNCLIWSLLYNVLSPKQRWHPLYIPRLCPLTVSLNPFICIHYQFLSLEVRRTRFGNREAQANVWNRDSTVCEHKTRAKSASIFEQELGLDLMYGGLEMPHIKQQKLTMQCLYASFIQGRVEQRQERECRQKYRKTQANFSQNQGYMPNGEIPRHDFIRSNQDGRDKPTTINKNCDGHLTLLLIFTSSDSWNAIWGEEEKKKKKKKKERERKAVTGKL